jgi:cation diffusion facilitator family transporter
LSEEGSRVTKVGLASNVFLTAFKGIAGVYYGSTALLADAGHSGADLLSDFVTLYALQKSRLPESTNYPYGLGKMDSLGGFVVSCLLGIGGIGIIGHAADALMGSGGEHGHLHELTMSSSAVWISVASIGVKEFLFQWTNRVGKKMNSPVLIANAWHHRSDALTSVVALLGIMGAQAGFPFLDPVGGILVASLIIRIGWQQGLECARNLLDGNEAIFSKDIAEKLINDGFIFDARDVRTRKSGPQYLVDIQICRDIKAEDLLRMDKSLKSSFNVKEVSFTLKE